MIDCVVSFSGGVESTALLEYLKNKELKVVAVYSHFPNSNTQAKLEYFLNERMRLQ